jgi:periplasmic protein TonB
MFEDSLVESTGRIRTRSKVYAVGSFAAMGVLVLIPYFYPASLPKDAGLTPLVAPPPPASAAEIPHVAASHTAAPVRLLSLVAPTVIPRHIAEEELAATPPGLPSGLEQGTGGLPEALWLLGSAPPLPSVVPRPKPPGPLHVSSGVAAGHLLAPIKPMYPAIARWAHVQGTVVIEAVITKQGLVGQARVVSGPAILAQAALEAVDRARYEPYRLNGESVEVETTINIVFTLDN